MYRDICLRCRGTSHRCPRAGQKTNQIARIEADPVSLACSAASETDRAARATIGDRPQQQLSWKLAARLSTSTGSTSTTRHAERPDDADPGGPRRAGSARDRGQPSAAQQAPQRRALPDPLPTNASFIRLSARDVAECQFPDQIVSPRAPAWSSPRCGEPCGPGLSIRILKSIPLLFRQQGAGPPTGGLGISSLS